MADTKPEASAQDGAVSQGAPAPEKPQDAKPTYKSFRKKFRKMMYKFDETMHVSNELRRQERQGKAKARKLAEEIDQILDLLLDCNDCAQIPADKRYDLEAGTSVPALSAIPQLIADDRLTEVSSLQSQEGQDLARDIRAMMEEKEQMKKHALQKGPKPPKPLSVLMSTVPHLSSTSPLVPPELLTSFEIPEGQDAPYGYLTPEQLDEYLDDIDAELGIAQPRKKTTSDADLRNPNDAYSWLRKHRPDCFLQDGEGSEKANGKPGALRGAGKRASLPAPSKPDALEFVEEDGIGYDAHLAGPVTGGRGKRKRDDGDDGTYHPKSGRVDETGAKVKKPRQARKKKSDGFEETSSSKGSARKGKASKARMSSPGIAEETMGIS